MSQNTPNFSNDPKLTYRTQQKGNPVYQIGNKNTFPNFSRSGISIHKGNASSMLKINHSMVNYFLIYIKSLNSIYNCI